MAHHSEKLYESSTVHVSSVGSSGGSGEEGGGGGDGDRHGPHPLQLIHPHLFSHAPGLPAHHPAHTSALSLTQTEGGGGDGAVSTGATWQGQPLAVA